MCDESAMNVRRIRDEAVSSSDHFYLLERGSLHSLAISSAEVATSCSSCPAIGYHVSVGWTSESSPPANSCTVRRLQYRSWQASTLLMHRSLRVMMAIPPPSMPAFTLPRKWAEVWPTHREGVFLALLLLHCCQPGFRLHIEAEISAYIRRMRP